jgi:hypothetical protein
VNTQQPHAFGDPSHLLPAQSLSAFTESLDLTKASGIYLGPEFTALWGRADAGAGDYLVRWPGQPDTTVHTDTGLLALVPLSAMGMPPDAEPPGLLVFRPPYSVVVYTLRGHWMTAGRLICSTAACA